MRELRCSKGTLDKCIATLKKSGLLSNTEKHYDPRSGTGRNAHRTLDRDLLEKEVARGEAEDRPQEEEKKRQRVCRRVLRNLGKQDYVTYGPTSRKDALAVGRCLKGLAGGDLVITGKKGPPDSEGQATTIVIIRTAETKKEPQGEPQSEQPTDEQ
jgi:hypothetical protein